jgi:hypothetical protein
VRRVLAERISAGRLRPGQRLGAERALAAELGSAGRPCARRWRCWKTAAWSGAFRAAAAGGTLAGQPVGHRYAVALGLALGPQ